MMENKKTLQAVLTYHVISQGNIVGSLYLSQSYNKEKGKRERAENLLRSKRAKI